MIASIRRRYPGAPVACRERVPGYLLRAAGLTVVTPLGRRQRHRQTGQVQPAERAYAGYVPGSGDASTASATPLGGGATASNLRPDRGSAPDKAGP